MVEEKEVGVLGRQAPEVDGRRSHGGTTHEREGRCETHEPQSPGRRDTHTGRKGSREVPRPTTTRVLCPYKIPS